jgi:hypothetical protein
LNKWLGHCTGISVAEKDLLNLEIAGTNTDKQYETLPAVTPIYELAATRTTINI